MLLRMLHMIIPKLIRGLSFYALILVDVIMTFGATDEYQLGFFVWLACNPRERPAKGVPSAPLVLAHHKSSCSAVAVQTCKVSNRTRDSRLVDFCPFECREHTVFARFEWSWILAVAEEDTRKFVSTMNGGCRQLVMNVFVEVLCNSCLFLKNCGSSCSMTT